MPQVILKPEADVNLDDSHLADPPQNGDELYERWRAGLIRRHICADGKLDEHIFLVERSNSNLTYRDDYSRRSCSELWTGKDAASSNLNNPILKTWWPLSVQSDNNSESTDSTDIFRITEILGKSFGGGDNPILTGGLALAMFSMESIGGYQHSIRYARMLFNYLESCENVSGFLRRRTGTKIKDASTDEIMGLVLGLSHYHKALSVQTAEAEEKRRVIGLADRIGTLLARHGYYYFPESDNYTEAYPTGDGPNLGYQRAYVFAHPINKSLGEITGKSYAAKWDDDEFRFYFGRSPSDPRRITDWPPPIFSSLAEYFEADSLRGQANVSTWSFFQLILSGVIAGKTITEIINNIVNDFIRVSTFFLTGGIGNIAIDLMDWEVELAPSPEEVKNFNYVMLAESCVLLLELYKDGKAGFTADRATVISNCFKEILSYSGRANNSFFACVASKAKLLSGGQASEFISTLNILMDHNVWQKDLPIGRISLLEHLVTDSDPPTDEEENIKFVHDARDWLDKEMPTWRQALRTANIGFDYNVANPKLLGEARGWEHLDDNRVYATNWNVRRSINGEGPGLNLFLKYFVKNSFRDIKIEACGMDLLFGRILCSHWDLMPFPILSKHVLYATAPYVERQSILKEEYSIGHGSYKLYHDNSNDKYDILKRPKYGRYDERKVSSFQQNKRKFPYELYNGSAGYINFKKYWISLFGGATIGGDGRYNGTKTFNYNNKTKYFVKVSDAFDYRLQFGLTKNTVFFSSWEQPFINPTLNTIDGTYLLRFDNWDESGLPSEIMTSSFNFYRFIGRMRFYGFVRSKDSVGNEYLLVAGDVRNYLRRLHSSTQIVGDRCYFLNPHTGIIHDSASRSQSHIDKIFTHGNSLLLPLNRNYDLKTLTKFELEYMIGNIYDSGIASLNDHGARYNLQRRDDYSLPWKMQNIANQGIEHTPYPRFVKFLATHPKNKENYELRNTRKLNLCSICFPPI
jgi:hypothetical protein